VSAGVTLPFRTHGAALALGADDATAITVRVQLPELWETIAVRCGSAVSVAALKAAALVGFSTLENLKHNYLKKALKCPLPSTT